MYPCNTHYTCVCPCDYTPCTPATLTAPVSVHVTTHRVPLQHSPHLSVSVHVSTHRVPLQHSLHLCLSMWLHIVYPCNTHCTCVCPCVYTPCTLQHSLHLCLSMCLHTVYPTTLTAPVSVHVSTHNVPLQHSLHLCLSMCLHTVYPCNTHCTCVCPCV